MLPRAPKSGSLERDRPVEFDSVVSAEDEACRCFCLILVDVEVDRPRLVVLRDKDACRSNFGLGASGSRGAYTDVFRGMVGAGKWAVGNLAVGPRLFFFRSSHPNRCFSAPTPSTMLTFLKVTRSGVHWTYLVASLVGSSIVFSCPCSQPQSSRAR